MTKRLAIVFCLVLVLGFFDYLFTTASAALSSGSSAISLPTLVPSVTASPSGAGMSEVNFSMFSKSGQGWASITQGYGRTPYSYMYINAWHNGIDIAAKYGAPIYSPASGTVIATGDQDDYCPRQAFGRFVVVSDPARQVVLMFAHLDKIMAAPGEAISKGAEIATVGATGDETGVHLHFSVFEAGSFTTAPAHGCGPYPQGRDIDPIPYLESLNS